MQIGDSRWFQPFLKSVNGTKLRMGNRLALGCGDESLWMIGTLIGEGIRLSGPLGQSILHAGRGLPAAR
jgi:hypothetical protein